MSIFTKQKSAVSDKKRVISDIEKHILYVVKQLVDAPDEVYVRKSVSNGVTRFHIETTTHDVGKVIGKKGMTIQSLRTVCRSIAAKNNLMIEIEVKED